MKRRTYSKFSYADRYLWSAVIDDHVTKRIRKAVGGSYVDEDTQIANLMNHLVSLGKGDLADDFVACLEERDLVEWKP